MIPRATTTGCSPARPRTRSLFFYATADLLDDLPVDAPADAGAVQRGSLGIGSLKGDSS